MRVQLHLRLSHPDTSEGLLVLHDDDGHRGRRRRGRGGGVHLEVKPHPQVKPHADKVREVGDDDDGEEVDKEDPRVHVGEGHFGPTVHAHVDVPGHLTEGQEGRGGAPDAYQAAPAQQAQVHVGGGDAALPHQQIVSKKIIAITKAGRNIFPVPLQKLLNIFWQQSLFITFYTRALILYR